ncbi:Trypsin-7 [Habropoda laboriosa]|uniref:Trypsin-7 n=1 Tax=Habropoda laboriosa TaxID=597456 RepID=A0A0L7RFU5_9HYME|nr:Trypsin-7 [Habropoda laboriosa]
MFHHSPRNIPQKSANNVNSSFPKPLFNFISKARPNETVSVGTPRESKMRPLVTGEERINLYLSGCIAQEKIQVKPFHVRAGSSSYYEDGDIYGVQSVVIHPAFNVINYDYDVGLVELSRSITFGSTKQPIKLPRTHTTITEGSLVRVPGWGAAEFLGPVSGQLLLTTMKKINNDDCQDANNGGVLTNRMFCALSDEARPCVGDSGSPLVYENTLFVPPVPAPQEGLTPYFGTSSGHGDNVRSRLRKPGFARPRVLESTLLRLLCPIPPVPAPQEGLTPYFRTSSGHGHNSLGINPHKAKLWIASGTGNIDKEHICQESWVKLAIGSPPERAAKPGSLDCELALSSGYVATWPVDMYDISLIPNWTAARSFQEVLCMPPECFDT